MRASPFRQLLAAATLSLFGTSLIDTSLLAPALRAETPAAPQESVPAIPSDKAEGWVSLYNGQDLSGWVQRNGWATFRVEGEAIMGKTAKGSPNSFLATAKEYGNFELRFEVKVDNALNSGVQFRSKSLPDKDNGRVHGPQVEIEAGPGEAGYIYSEGTGRGWLSKDLTKNTDAFKNGEWNQYYVRAEGKRLQTWLNGRLIEDLSDEASPDQGFIALQVHGIGADQGPFEVRWRNIAVRELK